MRTLSLSWSGARQGLITSGLNHVAHAGAGKMAKDPPTEQGEFMGQIRKNDKKRYIWDGNRWAELTPTTVGYSAKILSKNRLVHSNLKLNTNDCLRLGWGSYFGNPVFRISFGSKVSLIHKHFDLIKPRPHGMFGL